MPLFYTIDWKILRHSPVVTVRVKCLDKAGDVHYVDKRYRDWLGVCTKDLRPTIRRIKRAFPTIQLEFDVLNEKTYKKVLPYFDERLERGRLEFEGYTFYRVYVDSVEAVANFLGSDDVAYFQNADRLVRLHTDFCTKHDTADGFFYRWYDVNDDEEYLLDSFRMVEDENEMPRWRVAAFDLETVPTSGKNRVPTGTDPKDAVVMISVVKWICGDETPPQSFVLYLNPSSAKLRLKHPACTYLEYESEREMLSDFHALIDDCHVLTGYNIDNFDVPCLIYRLMWLEMTPILNRYSSRRLGDAVVPTYRDKTVVDLYRYFLSFSSHDLTSFKLDQVAKIKLGGGEGKIPLDSVGIHAWYGGGGGCGRGDPSFASLCESRDRKACFDFLKPRNVLPKRFGTFLDYLEYCLQDSELVRRLFEKERILTFLIARSNLAAWDACSSLHFGNSRFLLEVFKTQSVHMGFFVNSASFRNRTECEPSCRAALGSGKTYQGALNWFRAGKCFRNVAVLDFMGMYPVCLLGTNLSYETAHLMPIEEYGRLPNKSCFRAIPYRSHDPERVFDEPPAEFAEHFRYPSVDESRDSFVILVDDAKGGERAFLPSFVKYFLEKRRFHQKMWKETGNVIHYNTQTCIKLLLNSMYGTMASKDSPLAHLVIAMAIVTLARYQLVASYHFVQGYLGYNVCYADTDSLMVHRWPTDECDRINEYLNLPYVELKFEQRMKRLLVLSKKRYVYEAGDGRIVTKGFQKKVNGLVRFMTDKIVSGVMKLEGERGDPSDGWILWTETLTEAFLTCARNPQEYSITRKTRKLDQYVSKTCTAVKMLKRYPEKEGDYIDFTYSRADVSVKHMSDWVMDAKDCRRVDFEQLFISQKKIFCTLLNVGFWELKNPHLPCQMVINAIRWKCFVMAELKHFFATGGRKVLMLVERGEKYTFRINDHFAERTSPVVEGKVSKKRKRKRKRNDSANKKSEGAEKSGEPKAAAKTARKRKLGSCGAGAAEKKTRTLKFYFHPPATRIINKT